ncbi:hypothetical protein ZWY2020_016516 [Hordeum vulgare]|nr:hypothetical protein ZWY2020_016516 [Hordeum vulgare]
MDPTPPPSPPTAPSLCFPRSVRRWADWAEELDADEPEMLSEGRAGDAVSGATMLGLFDMAAMPVVKVVGGLGQPGGPPGGSLSPLYGPSRCAARAIPRGGRRFLPIPCAATSFPRPIPVSRALWSSLSHCLSHLFQPSPDSLRRPAGALLLVALDQPLCARQEGSAAALSAPVRPPSPLVLPSPRRSYREVLMTRHVGDGQSRPKRSFPADQGPHPANSARNLAQKGGAGVGSSRPGRVGTARPGRSLEYYSETSLRRPPPPRDPYRDHRLPLPGWPGDIRCQEAARTSISDLDWEAALPAQLVACPPPVSRPRDEPAPRAPPARAPAHRTSKPSWRRDRQHHRREERRGGPHMPCSDDDRRSDCRSSRVGGADPKIPHVAPLPASAPAKKSKKKKAAGANPRGAGCMTPPGAPEQEASDPPARVSRQRSREDTMCINCGCAGHFRSECEPPSPPRCPTTLAYLGYGTERGSFYFVDVEIEEEEARPHLATVTLAPEQATPDGLLISADLIQAELATYIGDFRDFEFAWEVTETTPLVFSVPFPSAELLRVCSHDFIRCPINKFMISVQAAATEPDPVPPLEKVWVLVYGLPRGGSAAPRGGKLTHILKAISEPVGKLITTDLASFEDDGLARIEILCPTPAEIDGLSLVFSFGSKGRRLTFELESPAPVDPLDPAPAGPEPGDGGLDDEGGSSEEGSSSEGDDDAGGALLESSDGRRNPDTSAAGPSGPAEGTPVVALVPVAAVGTGLPLPVSAGPVVAAKEEVSVGMEVWPASSPRSPGVVCYSRSPRSPPSPTLGSPDPGPLTAVDPGWVSENPPAPHSRPSEGASPVVAAR